jgi:hypothetical protein
MAIVFSLLFAKRSQRPKLAIWRSMGVAVATVTRRTLRLAERYAKQPSTSNME